MNSEIKLIDLWCEMTPEELKNNMKGWPSNMKKGMIAVIKGHKETRAYGNMTDPCVCLIRAINTCFYKIGYTIDVKNRLKSLQTANPHELELICIYVSPSAAYIEKELHKKYSESRIRENNEWFDMGDEVGDNFISHCHVIDNWKKDVFI